MPSETDFLNDALGQIGAGPIVAIDDDTVNANWCKTFYPALRKGLLRSHHWNFAEARVSLAQDVAVPTFEFAYSYSLPTDLLKIKQYNGNAPSVMVATPPDFWYTVAGFYKIEGRHLLTNDGQALIVYVKDVTNPNLWDALFYQALATQLASKLALAIAKDSGKSKELMTQFAGILLPLALAVDGQEGTVTPYVVDDLLWGR